MREIIKNDVTCDAITALNREAFVGLERASNARVTDTYNNGVVFVDWDGDTLKGTALVTTDDRRFNEPYIWMIAVDREYRGQGVATRLLGDVENFTRKSGAGGISLMVNSNNVDAIRLYLKEGYRVKRFISGYYGSGDGLMMRRII